MDRKTSSVTVFTALFDLNRNEIDGRGMDIYRSWLSKTIELFPGIVIFHDGSLNQNNIEFFDAKLIRLNKEDLEFFKLENSIKELFKKFIPQAKNDITFQLPQYSLMQFSKFSLAKYAKQISNSDGYLWVDAGISRFIKKIDPDTLKQNSTYVASQNYNAAFELDLRHNLSITKGLVQAPIGSCKRIFSGTSFWINNAFTDQLNDLMLNTVQEWISEGIWDNEQVALR